MPRLGACPRVLLTTSMTAHGLEPERRDKHYILFLVDQSALLADSARELAQSGKERNNRIFTSGKAFRRRHILGDFIRVDLRGL